jgi:putative ABC transport system substrate-binding protein
MNRKIIICLFSTVLLTTVSSAEAQQTPMLPRIGLIYPGPKSDATYSSRHDAFRQGLRQLGYIEGQNIIVDDRYADGKLDRQPALAADLVRSKADIIVAGGTTGVIAAKQVTSTIPIVMAFTGDDPVRAGFVASLARPGGNITGLTNITSELAGKRLELLREIIPKISHVSFLYYPTNPAAKFALHETEAAARAFKVRLQSLTAQSADEFESAFRAAVNGHAEAMIIQSGGLFTTHQNRIIDLASKNRLPAMYTEQYFAMGGGLMAYATSIVDLYSRAATYVDKILKGAQPGDLPVERPTKFELVINLKAAKQIGLTIPPNVLARADRVIK